MNKALFILALVLLGVVLVGCSRQLPTASGEDLFNDSLNQEIENLTNPSSTDEDDFVEFKIDIVKRNDTKYEIALEDAFELSGGNLTSLDISVLGVKLGDRYEEVIYTLGLPDVAYIAADKSYKNLDYSKKIGIGGLVAAVTFHLDNDTVTSINMRPPLNKYLQGNTSLGIEKEYIYSQFDLPDYQDFILNHKAFHYVEKGIDFYINRDQAQIISLVIPREFNGVEYVTVLKEENGVTFNVTQAVLK
ncbi:hypothetical protein JW711_04010 [Candidatus Woesearchaeota archaeon]|nr:hypothetical protein [Candidatus Woesearchaeota archaeon]